MADDRQIQQALQHCQAKFLKLLRESPLVLELTSASDDRYIEVNDTFERVTGWHRNEVIGKTPSDIKIMIDPSQRAEMLKQLLSGGTVQNFKLDGRMKNGEIRIGSASAALIDVNGQTCVLTLILDTTDVNGIEETRRVAERLSRVLRRLLQAHEEEYASIVRELHNYSDCLAILSAALDRLHHDRSELAAETRKELGNARRLVEDLFYDIQALSHRLHSPKLEYLGLPAAAASFCRELATQKNVSIEFASEGVPLELPQEVSLVLFHVLREVLENAVAHSGSQRVEVLLKGGANQVDLTVRDWGSGFISEEALKGHGIGLTVSEERLKIVNGKLTIESQPQRGTTIYVHVPLKQPNAATTK